MQREEVLEVIYEAVRRANELRPPDAQMACAEATGLFGTGGNLDSLGLVSFLLDVEEGVNDRAGTALVLADERAMAQKLNPFRDVRSLADYVLLRLQEPGA